MKGTKQKYGKKREMKITSVHTFKTDRMRAGKVEVWFDTTVLKYFPHCLVSTLFFFFRTLVFFISIPIRA